MLKKLSHLLLLFLIVIASVPAEAASRPLGVNLTSRGAFVDIIKQAHRYKGVSKFDEHGWPMGDFQLIIDRRPVAEWSGHIDDPERHRVDYSGVYEGSFVGQATVRATGGGCSIVSQRYAFAENKTYFTLEVPAPDRPNHAFIMLSFSDTLRHQKSARGTGITELKLHRPGYPLDTDKLFTDEYLTLCEAADFQCYRFYGVQNIWGSEPAYPNVTRWKNRKLPEDAAQSAIEEIGKRDGWCWEYIIMLANHLGEDIWINIPISCDEDYVLQLARMLQRQLRPDITIYVENSNEVWSPKHQTHGPYNQAQAEARGIGFDENYARRSVELAKLFARVFGEEAINERIRVILAGQHAYHGRSDKHLKYIDNTFGSPKQFIYATSIALYFRSTHPDGDPEAINQGMLEDIHAQINDPKQNTYRGNPLDKARQWELPGGCTSYEGGPHIPSGGSLQNLDNQILAHRTPQMKDILKENYEDGWFALGGGLSLYFSLDSGYNRYGCWGLTDDYTQPDRNHKMQAVREILEGK